VEANDNEVKIVPLSEVKNILKKASKERKELLYEQRIALEHAQKFAKLPVKKINDLIKELMSLEYLDEVHAIKIADLLPATEDDVKTIFAKQRITLGENEIKKILEIVGKYYVE
jgi:DNA-directed RNA polymerase subunit F